MIIWDSFGYNQTTDMNQVVWKEIKSDVKIGLKTKLRIITQCMISIGSCLQ